MIAQIDILSEVAKFMPFADSLLAVSTDAYRLHPHLANVRTTEMFTTVPELLTTLPDPTMALEAASVHPIPELLADFILTKDDTVKNYEEIITGLARNLNWRDDVRPRAVRFLAFVLCNEEADEDLFMDVVLMKKACRYDAVMREYSRYEFAVIENIKDYFHGRSLEKMYSLAPDRVQQLADICVDVYGYESFIDYIAQTRSRATVKFVLKNTIVPAKWTEILREKY